MHFIYLITNQVNGKVYVGITRHPKRRWQKHLNLGRKPNHRFRLYQSMYKHGIDNFTFEIIAFCFTNDHANELEMEYIAKYNSFSDYGAGYNMTLGGRSKAKITEETRAKMSAARKANPSGDLTKGPKSLIGTHSWNAGKFGFQIKKRFNFTEQDVLNIKADTRGVREIAPEYNCSYMTIQNIKHGKRLAN
jgi:group I intron endonuclease